MEEPGPDEAVDEDLQPVYSRIEAGDIGELNVAGRDITQIIHGVPPEKHAEVLAKNDSLMKKLAEAEAANKERPTEDEMRAAAEAIDTAEELEEAGRDS